MACPSSRKEQRVPLYYGTNRETTEEPAPEPEPEDEDGA